MNILSPSILAADFARLGEQVEKVTKAGAQYLHIDVMDGMFVPQISFGFPVIESIRPITDIVFDVHLMISQPERYIEQFAKLGANNLTIHVEACHNMMESLTLIRKMGMKPGIALHPQTPIQSVYPYLDSAEQVLVMTVNTGFGGQKYIDSCTEKITAVRQEILKRGLSVDVEADGGVTLSNAEMILEAGANVIVSGSSIFNGDIEKNVEDFQFILKGHEH